MNRINPLYILTLFIVITISSFLWLIDINEKLKNSEEKVVKIELVGQKFGILKNVWHDNNEIKKQINFLISDNIFKKANISTNYSNGSATIKMLTDDKNLISLFVQKLLNKNFRINNLFISQSSVSVEVKLK